MFYIAIYGNYIAICICRIKILHPNALPGRSAAFPDQNDSRPQAQSKSGGSRSVSEKQRSICRSQEGPDVKEGCGICPFLPYPFGYAGNSAKKTAAERLTLQQLLIRLDGSLSYCPCEGPPTGGFFTCPQPGFRSYRLRRGF